MEPAFVGIRMALETVIVHHERFGRDEISTRGPSQGRMEVVCAFGWPGLVPFSRIMSVQCHHRSYGHTHRAHPTQPDAPFYARSRQAMQNVEPDCHERGDHVRP